MRVVVTGAAGRLAHVLLPLLCAERDIARVIGVDRREPAFRHPKFEATLADIGEARARASVRGADALAHLASVVLRGRMPVQEMARTNVEATRALLSAAAAAGVPVIVHLSSAAVYGPGVDLAEDAPLAPLARFHYARQKAEIDAWLARELPRAAVLRPTIVLGPHAQPLLRQIAALPLYPRLPDPEPRLQLVHEGDVAQAVVLALRERAAGPFNLAAPSTFSLRELAQARHPRAPGVPLAFARVLLALAWRTSGWGGEPGWFDGIASSLTLDCRRARALLGWVPRHEDWREIAGARA